MMKTIPYFFAEVKTCSPYGFKSQYSWDQLFLLAKVMGDCVSIHTDERWGGSFNLLRKARQLTDKPILAKGIHTNDEDIEKCFDYGANYVLVVGRIPEQFTTYPNLIIEPNSFEQLKLCKSKSKVLWNSRALDTGKQRLIKFEDARKRFNGYMIQGSFIKTVNDIKPGADAIIVGQHLVEFCESLRNEI